MTLALITAYFGAREETFPTIPIKEVNKYQSSSELDRDKKRPTVSICRGSSTVTLKRLTSALALARRLASASSVTAGKLTGRDYKLTLKKSPEKKEQGWRNPGNGLVVDPVLRLRPGR